MKKAIVHCYCLCRRLFKLSVLLIALILILARVLCIYLENNVPYFIDKASIAIGAPVEVESFSTEWRGLSPLISLKGVRIGELESLSVESIQVKPDLLSSLFGWTIAWSRFDVEGLDVQLNELASGNWSVAGIGASDGNGGSIDFLESMILESNRVSIIDSHLYIKTLLGSKIDVELNSLSLNYSLSFRRLSIDATLGAKENKLTLVAELTGDEARFFDLDGLAYAKIDVQSLDGIYGEFLERVYPGNSFQVSSDSSIKAQLWANLTLDEELAFQGSVEINDIPEQVFGFDCTNNSCLENLASAKMGVYGTYSHLSQHIDVREPQLELFGDLIQAPDFRAKRTLNNGDVDYSLLLPSMNLSELVSSVEKFPFESNALTDALFILAPSGQVSFFSLEIPNFDTDRLRVSGRVNGLNIGSYRGAPAGRDVNADFLLNKTNGLVEVSSKNSSISFPTVYDDFLGYNEVSSTVSLELDLDSSRIEIASYNTVVHTDQGTVNGAFRVDAPLTAGQSVGVDLTLSLGMENAQVEDHTILVPDSLPDDLNDWMDTALITGNVGQASVFYRGSLKKGEPEKRTVQVRAKMSDAELRFIDTWPSLTNIDAELWVSDNNIRAYSNSAKILDIALESSIVNVDATEFSASNTDDGESVPEIILNLSSNATGKTNSALDLVRKTSLRDGVGDALDDLLFTGDLSSKIELRMPVKEQLDRSELDINIVAQVASNSLMLSKQDLLIESLKGQVTFDNTGLHAENITADIWNKTFSVEIMEEIDQGLVGIDLLGLVDILDVTDWLELPVTSELAFGEVEVEGRIDLITAAVDDSSEQSPNRFHFWSNLIGAETKFPEPLNKQSSQVRNLDVSVEVDEQIKTLVRVGLDADELDNSGGFNGQFNSEQERKNELVFELIQQIKVDPIQNPPKSLEPTPLELEIIGARLTIDKSLTTPAEQPVFRPGHFLANASLGELDLTSWLDLISNSSNQVTTNTQSTVNDQAELKEIEILGLAPELNLGVDALSYEDRDLGNVKINAREQDSVWQLMFETDYVQGRYQLAGAKKVLDDTLDAVKDGLPENGIVESDQNNSIQEDKIGAIEVAVNADANSPTYLAPEPFPVLTIFNLDIDLLKNQFFPNEGASTNDINEQQGLAHVPIELHALEMLEDMNFEPAAEVAVDSRKQIESSALDDSESEKQAVIDPRTLPALKFDIQSLQMGGLERGSWSGVMEPFGLGLLVSELKGGYGSLMLAEEEEGSSVFWGVDGNNQFTEVNLTFNYQDIGDLFRLSGVDPAMSSKDGLLYASFNWDGGPQDFSINSVDGIMGFSARNGSFNTNSEDVPNTLLKTIGLFNVGSWTRRLKFDFSDVSATGTPYDRIIGDFVVERGMVFTLTPVSVELSSGDILFDGNIDLNTEELDARLVVTLPARQNITWVAALVAGLPAAAGVWLVGQIFDDELDSLSSVSYRIEGSLDKPDISADKVFNSTIEN